MVLRRHRSPVIIPCESCSESTPPSTSGWDFAKGKMSLELAESLLCRTTSLRSISRTSVLRKRSYLTKEMCTRVIDSPLRIEPQEKNRFRFWAAVPELDNRYLRVITLDDKLTIHNAFLDRRFKP